MLANKKVNAKLKRALKRRLAAVYKLVDSNSPTLEIADKIGAVINLADQLCGKKTVSSAIRRKRKETEAQDAGICWCCYERPSMHGFSVCKPCNDVIERDEAIWDFKNDNFKSSRSH